MAEGSNRNVNALTKISSVKNLIDVSVVIPVFNRREMVIRAVRDRARVRVVPIDRRARQQGKSRGSTWGNALRMLGRLLTLRRIL